MRLEEFGNLPSHLEDWTFDTVVNLVKKYEFEPSTFDYKNVFNPTGPNRDNYIVSIRRTACSMANTGGRFILFGVKDRRVAVAVLEDPCQVPESLDTKIRVDKGESLNGLPQQTDWERDSSDSHEAALDGKSSPKLRLHAESHPASDRAAAQLRPALSSLLLDISLQIFYD